MSETEEKGHRRRLRERFASWEKNSRSEEALLELLLTYSIPQKDVQPLAKRLLAEFGDLLAVIEAPLDRLSKVDGIKGNSIVLFKLVDWIRQHYAGNQVIKKGKKSTTQAALFDIISDEKKDQAAPIKSETRHKKVKIRRGSDMFTNAVLKEAVALLPGAPDTESLEEFRAYLRDNLHYNAEQTRQRYASYITRRMFSEGYANASIRKLAKTFPDNQVLRDACFYRFIKTEPLEVRIVEDLLLPNLGTGRIGRDLIRKYLAEKYPQAKSIKDCGQAVVDAMEAGGIAKIDRTKVTFSLRHILIPSFAFVLHSEFPEPGMHDIQKIEDNRMIRAMLWNPEQILPSLYELRNRELISKVSEIDDVRQFTTRYTLAEVVERIIVRGEGT